MTALVKATALGEGLVIDRDDPVFVETCTHMALEFQEATAEMCRLAEAVQTQATRIYDAFRSEINDTHFNPFTIGFCHSGRRDRDDLKTIVEDFKRSAWRMIFDRLGVKKLMSVKKRGEFERRLEKGELPEITPETVMDVILSTVESAEDFAKEAALEVFEILRPTRGEYKTNSAFRVGKRVILEWQVESAYRGAFRVNYNREQQLIAIDGIFHLLDGKGIMKDRRGELVAAINACEHGVGETTFFRFKCFKNRNLHLEFKRLDLVKQLNFLGAGELVLGAGD